MEDLRDGTVLCSLVEALQGRRLKGWSPNPTNQHHKLENVTTALQAIEDDGVKLVNIGTKTQFLFNNYYFLWDYRFYGTYKRDHDVCNVADISRVL